MIKNFLIVAGAALLLASCSSRQKDSASVGADTDSAFIQEAEAKADSIDAVLPFLTPDSLGPVKTGMKVSDLPQGVPGLYDNVSMDNNGDGGHVYTFMMGTEAMFDVYDFGEGTVDVISLQSPRLGVNTPDGILSTGMPMKKLLAQKGVTTDFVSLDDEGVWYWRYQGLWFYPSLDTPDQALDQALSNRNTPPAAAIVADAPIGYIATGSPF